MKRQIRQSVFETNSSSVHSLTMCTSEEYRQWGEGKLLLSQDTYNTHDRFLPVDKGREFNALELMKHLDYLEITVEQVEAYKRGELSLSDLVDGDYYGYYLTEEEWEEDIEERFETFSQEYNGVVAFGYYRSDY